MGKFTASPPVDPENPYTAPSHFGPSPPDHFSRSYRREGNTIWVRNGAVLRLRCVKTNEELPAEIPLGAKLLAYPHWKIYLIFMVSFAVAYYLTGLPILVFLIVLLGMFHHHSECVTRWHRRAGWFSVHGCGQPFLDSLANSIPPTGSRFLHF